MEHIKQVKQRVQFAKATADRVKKLSRDAATNAERGLTSVGEDVASKGLPAPKGVATGS